MSPPHVPPKPGALDPPQLPQLSPVSSSRLSKIRSSLGSRGGVLVLGSLPGWEGGWGGPAGGPGGLREGNQELTQRRSRAGRPGSQKSWCSRRSAGCWRRSQHGRPSGNPLPARSTLRGHGRAGVLRQDPQAPQNTAPQAMEIPPQGIVAPPHSLGVPRAALRTGHAHPWGPQRLPRLGKAAYPHPWDPQSTPSPQGSPTPLGTCPDTGGPLTHKLGNSMSPPGHRGAAHPQSCSIQSPPPQPLGAAHPHPQGTQSPSRPPG